MMMNMSCEKEVECPFISLFLSLICEQRTGHSKLDDTDNNVDVYVPDNSVFQCQRRVLRVHVNVFNLVLRHMFYVFCFCLMCSGMFRV